MWTVLHVHMLFVNGVMCWCWMWPGLWYGMFMCCVSTVRCDMLLLEVTRTVVLHVRELFVHVVLCCQCSAVVRCRARGGAVFSCAVR